MPLVLKSILTAIFLFILNFFFCSILDNSRVFPRGFIDTMFPVLALSSILSLIPATIASKKGRNFFVWALYGWLVFIVSIIHVNMLKPIEGASNMKKCPFCAEMIKQEAKVCRYCNKDLPEDIEPKTIEEYKGIRIGDNSSKILSALGNPKKKNNNEWIYKDITLVVADNIITEIKTA